MSTPYLRGRICTPLGTMIAVVDEAGAVVRLDFEDDSRRDESAEFVASARPDPLAVLHVERQLDEYFRGERRRFEVSLAPIGTPFLVAAWRALVGIPYGTMVSYGALAKRMLPSSSARAIGRANAINPISILVPCHRVVGANGHLTGYSGGLDRKQALQDLEQIAGVNLPLFEDR